MALSRTGTVPTPAWGSTLASTFRGFRVLSHSDRARVSLFVFCTCLDQAGARFGLGLARGFLVFETEPCLEAFKP